MITIEELTNNKLWYISPSEAKDLAANGNLLSYEFCNIELDKIRRFVRKKRKFIKLEETVNYRFLSNQNSKQALDEYIKYCNETNTITEYHSPENFITLYKKILKDGYNPKKGVIIIDQHNAICDGLHRACSLLYINKNKKIRIQVLKVKVKTSRLHKLSFLIPMYKIFNYCRKKLKMVFYNE